MTAASIRAKVSPLRPAHISPIARSNPVRAAKRIVVLKLFHMALPPSSKCRRLLRLNFSGLRKSTSHRHSAGLGAGEESHEHHVLRARFALASSRDARNDAVQLLYINL